MHLVICSRTNRFACCGNRKPLTLCDNAHNESNERVYEYSERIKNGRAA